jgi:hypothetical protein
MTAVLLTPFGYSQDVYGIDIDPVKPRRSHCFTTHLNPHRRFSDTVKFKIPDHDAYKQVVRIAEEKLLNLARGTDGRVQKRFELRRPNVIELVKAADKLSRISSV